MNGVYENPSTMNTNEFKQKCFVKLKNLLIEQWNDNITCNTSVSGQTNKLRVYKLFKQSFTSEPYLEHLKDFHSRKMITKFRCSDHTLEIERRRHKKLKLEDRKCQICNYDIETEKHFLQECPGFTSASRGALYRA